MIETTIQYKINPEQVVDLIVAPGVFKPTGTTSLLIKAVKEKILTPCTILDLGCGSGIVGLSLAKHSIVKHPLFASDLSSTAVACTIKNFKNYNFNVDAREGSMFEPWENCKFDVIVDDISGVAEEIAKVSTWFQGVPCNSGEDGTSLINNIIKESRKYLNKKGKFFFPVISLSNVDSLLKEAKNAFKNVELISKQEWPLPDELKSQHILLEELRDKGFIKLEKKFGMYIWYTEIYVAFND